MCAIIDASVTFEVFGQRQTPAGIAFRQWLDGGHGSLVVGGKNLEELGKNGNFGRWFIEARRFEDRVEQVKAEVVSEHQQVLVQSGNLKSDDAHVLALAVASGARLLYSNDRALSGDFSNPKILGNPRGKVYSTLLSKAFNDTHKELLETENLCG